MAAAKRKKTANKRSAASASKKAGRKKTSASGSKKAAAKKTASKKAAPKKTASKKSARKSTKKAAAPRSKKAAPKKSTAKKKSTAAKKTTAKKTTAKKAAAKKATANQAAPKGRPPKKAPAKRSPKVRVVGSRTKLDSTEPPPPPSSRRNFGLRGAAPWVARHAAKHAEELRRRNAEPPPPGSARATLRTPKDSEAIKSQISELHQRSSKIRSLRKKLDKSFYEIGLLLAEVQRLELYEAKGYSSFEAFLDREVDLPRGISLRLIRITHTFQRETAYDFGIERLGTALAALDGEITAAAPSHPSSRGWSSAGLPVKPPIRFDD